MNAIDYVEGRIYAPWTPEQFAMLQRWQACDWVHPFTCCGDDGMIVDMVKGFLCPHCGRTQNWAHKFMADELPKNPITLLDKQNKEPQFVIMEFADISTFHVSKEDGKLLEHGDSETPLICGNDPKGYGTWFYVPSVDVWQEQKMYSRLLKYGFSEHFCLLMKSLSIKGIPYVRFDRDGPVTEGLKTFDW